METMKRDYYEEMRQTYENATRETGEGKKIVFSVCPETFKRPCKLCDACKLILWHKDANTQDKIDKAGELNRKEKYYANVILASNPSEVIVFEYGPTIGNKLVSYEMGLNSDYKGFMDPDRGHNMVIVKYPNPDPKKTRYDVEPRVNATALPDRSVLGRMVNLDNVIEQIRSGNLRTLYQSKLPAGRTEIRFLPSWLGRQFASVFQLKYKLHYHTSEDELDAIQKGQLNPLEDIIIERPAEIAAGPTKTTGQPNTWGNDWAITPTPTPPSISPSDWGQAPSIPSVPPSQDRLACFGTYDETEPECTLACAKSGRIDLPTGLLEQEACKKELEKKVAQRRAAKGLYR
jgi:hypothetical protein